MPRPVIIDTDPGIDDAVAILYALRSAAFTVLGLTTVAGNISLTRTTENALRILALADVDVPVVSGAEAPLIRAPFAALDVHGNDGLGGVELPEPRGKARTGAVEWMAEMLLERPAESVDLLVLGPMTNIAHLLQHAPEAARRVGRIIAMGGAIAERGNVGPRAEFNMAADPEAADVVFAAGLPLTMIPLDVTRKVRAGRDDVEWLRNCIRPEARVAGRLIDAYFQTTDGGDLSASRPLHDPCVMLFAEAPEIFGCEDISLSVDLSPPRDGGALLPGPHQVRVARTVDAGSALALILERLSAP